MSLSPIERIVDDACGYTPPATPAPDHPYEEVLNQLGAEVAAEVLNHIDTMYPAMWAGVPKLARTSVRRTIIQAVRRALTTG